jgi:hypothetical protein
MFYYEVEKRDEKSIFLKRLYKTEMGIPTVSDISYVIELFNRAKRFAFQTMVREKRWRKIYDNSLHIVVKKKFGLNDYFANSVVREAKALFSSRMELNDLYIQQTDEKIKDVKKKLKTERTKGYEFTQNQRELYQRKPAVSEKYKQWGNSIYNRKQT